jgi:hypothetical protein
MRVGRHNLGTILAILAGLWAIAFAVWPVVPLPAHGETGTGWGVTVWVIGAAFILAAFLGDQHTVIARAILFIGSALLIASALVFGQIASALGLDFARAAVELLPALMAVIAGFLIGPIERSAAEIRAARSGKGLPAQPVPPDQQVPFDNDRAA